MGGSMGSAISQTFEPVLDVLTLGASYQARKQAQVQEQALRQMQDAQEEQLNLIKKQGPAPRMEAPDEAAQSLKRARRLQQLAAGFQSTIRNREALGSSRNVYNTLATGAVPMGSEVKKTTLGE